MPLGFNPEQFAEFCLGGNRGNNLDEMLAGKGLKDFTNEDVQALLNAIKNCEYVEEAESACYVLQEISEMPGFALPANKQMVRDIFKMLGSNETELKTQMVLLESKAIRDLIPPDDIVNHIPPPIARRFVHYPDVRERLSPDDAEKMIFKYYDNPYDKAPPEYRFYRDGNVRKLKPSYLITRENENDIQGLMDISGDDNINRIVQKCRYGELLRAIITMDDIPEKLTKKSILRIWRDGVDTNLTSQNNAITKLLLEKRQDVLFSFNPREISQIMIHTDLLLFYNVLKDPSTADLPLDERRPIKNFDLLIQADGQEYLREMKAIIGTLSGYDKQFAKERYIHMKKEVMLANDITSEKKIIQGLDAALPNGESLDKGHAAQKIKILISHLDAKCYDQLKWGTGDNQKVKEEFIHRVTSIVEDYGSMLTDEDKKIIWEKASRSKVAGYQRLGRNVNVNRFGRIGNWKKTKTKTMGFFDKLAENPSSTTVNYRDSSYEVLSKKRDNEDSLSEFFTSQTPIRR